MIHVLFPIISNIFVTNPPENTYLLIEAFIDDALKVKKSTNNNKEYEEFI